MTSARAIRSSSSLITALIEALRLLGGMVFGVLRQVAMRARFRDRLDDARPLFLLAPAQLFLERCEPVGGHRDLVHFLTFPAARPERAFPGSDIN